MVLTTPHRTRLFLALTALLVVAPPTQLPQLVVSHAQSSAMPVTLSVKDFGATGDGLTDDYAALKRAAEAICAAPAGSTLVYPAGRYRIAQHKIEGGPLANTVTDITYSNCRSVAIT